MYVKKLRVMCALSSGNRPEGSTEGSLRLLADQVFELFIDIVSHETNRQVLTLNKDWMRRCTYDGYFTIAV